MNGYPETNSEDELNQVRKAFFANYIYRKIIASFTGNRAMQFTGTVKDDAGNVLFDGSRSNGAMTPYDAAAIAMAFFNSRYSPDDPVHTNILVSNKSKPNEIVLLSLISSRKTAQEPRGGQGQSPIVGTENIQQENVNRLAAAINALNKNVLTPACARVQLVQAGKQPSYQKFRLKDSRGKDAIMYDRTASNNNWMTGAEGGGGGIAGGKSHLAVIFPGLDPEKYFGKEAEKILRQLGLLADIQPVLDMSRQIYGDVDLALSFDDGV